MEKGSAGQCFETEGRQPTLGGCDNAADEEEEEDEDCADDALCSC